MRYASRTVRCELLEEAVYGLPEVNRRADQAGAPDRRAGLLSHRPTSFLPLLEAGLSRCFAPDRGLRPGVSGGTSGGRFSVFRDASESMKAYGSCRHLPEIRWGCSCGQEVGLDLRSAFDADDPYHSTLYATVVDRSVDLRIV